ncbi:hypothetical protein NUW58_g3673 [Xylaria curta]|uniref:Uncharacterized protein n=1 Tax=Xylaria curta TaxID=42375 RepID=A0ACC1PCL3_9PEZI|nr:hypothetical protein NUW58_g3673 [Xylaria curta]
MSRHIWGFAIRAWLVCLLIHTNAISALSWKVRTNTRSTGQRFQLPVPESSNSAPELLRNSAQPPTSYEIALNELQELESEPLCHRIAARLLVNNCQLLEGKDEATVLTDSGRKIRDFVDSYAASLAICDLERGRFAIPTQCTKFQEPALSQLPMQDAAHLHVTSAEIDGCLSGLGASDSAWNTWISYRHKALRFCEAARADNEKAQNVILFQRLTRIMRRLADDVDIKIDQRMNDLDSRAQAAEERVETLSPLLRKLQHDLENVDSMISDNLHQGMKAFQDQFDSGLESAIHLERILRVILKDAMDGHAEAAAAHDQSLQLMSQRTTSEMGIVIDTMASAVAAVVILQNQIETSRAQAIDLESRQDNLEQGMQRLINISDTLATKYDIHTRLLQQAQNITQDILDTLGDTAASAIALGGIFPQTPSFKSWWIYIWCPVVSLVMGSYGLPPSLLRNLALFALGETAGFIISSFPLSLDLTFKPITTLLWSFTLQTTEANLTFTNSTSPLPLQ